MTSDDHFSISEIGQIAIPVSDLAQAVTFYRDVLGMNFLFQAPPQMAFFNCGGIRLLLDASGEGDRATRSSVIYYKVHDLEGDYAELKARGVSFHSSPHLVATMPDHELWMAFFQDPFGNLLALMSEVPNA